MTDLFSPFFTVFFFSFSRMLHCWSIQYVVFSDYHLSLNNIRLNFLSTFSSSEIIFFYCLIILVNEWTTYGCVIDCLFTHLLNNILATFNIVQLIINKVVINFCVGFCANVRFQLLWVNTKEHDWWIVC